MAVLLSLLIVMRFVSLSEGLFGMGRMQSVGVTGRLLCNGMPTPGIRVKLYDSEVFFDHELAITYSNPMGVFLLSGHKREFTSIDPRLYIYHRCNYNGPCLKKSEIEVPRQFITDGKIPMVSYQLGPVELTGRFHSDSVDCIN